jgi:hypothetical protein
MPKFDFYPSFNAGEVSPFIDARTSLEKYRSACRTLENFQILPYGGVIRRPGTEFRGTTLNPNLGEVRLIGFNFSTTTRFVIEMGVGYMRFWNASTGQLQTNASGGILTVNHPYVGAHLREVQFVQINDLMYFAHANYPPRKLSRLADNNWTFENVLFDYPPLFEQNTTDTTIRVSNEIGYTTLTASTPIFDDSMNGGQWALEWKRPLATVSVNIGGNWLSNLMDVEGDWTFTTFGTWDATVQILRYPNDKMEKGYTQTGTLTRSGATATVNHTAHGYNTGDLLVIEADNDTAPFDTGRTSLKTITVISENAYTYPVANSGATTCDFAFVENISQMEVVKEYDRATGESNIITTGTESARCGLMIRVLNYTSNTNGRAVIESSDFRTGGLVTIVDTYMAAWQASTAYVVGDYVTQGGANYKCTTPHTSGATFDVTKWIIQNGLTSSTKAGANVTRWLSASARAGAKTLFWSEAAFSAKRGYPRSVAMHEQRLCFGGTSSQPNTIWCSQIDNFENFKTGVTASDAVQFTLAASEGNRINWMYSQSQLLIGTSGDEWTIGSADSSASLSATNVQASRQSSYGSKYMRAALVNDVLLFVQRNGRKVRELVYELNKDGWVAPDLTLLAEHITSGEIVEVAYQQQPDAVLWCVRGDGTLIAMTYERDQKVVGWHRHVIADNALVESVATIYGNGTEDEVWMVVKRTVSGQDYRTIERFPLLWRKYLDDQTANSWRYLDGWSAFASGAAGRSISGLDRFNGKTVTVMQDGRAPITRTVASGAITVPTAAAGYVGLPYTSTLTPMKLDMDLEDGSSQGRKKRIHKIIARLYKSRGGEISTNNGQWYALADSLTTGDQKMILAGAFGIDADVTLRQTAPYPMAVIALQPVWDTFGNE